LIFLGLLNILFAGSNNGFAIIILDIFKGHVLFAGINSGKALILRGLLLEDLVLVVLDHNVKILVKVAEKGKFITNQFLLQSHNLLFNLNLGSEERSGGTSELLLELGLSTVALGLKLCDVSGKSAHDVVVGFTFI
jgi:hypothetical protein